MLKTDGCVLGVEAVSGLAAGQKAGLGLHSGRDAGKLDAADMHRRRDDCEVHRRELLRAQAAGESGFHRCLDAFGRQHLFKCLANSFKHGAVGRQEAAIEREALVKLGVEFFARR